MPFVFDWATLGTANGSAGIVDGTKSTTLNVASDPAVFYNGFQGGNLWVSGITSAATSTVTFTTPIKNAAFEIFDVDSNGVSYDDQVTILAFDVNGDPVDVIFSDLEAYHTQTGNTVEADGGTSTGVEGSGAPDSISVAFGGPVATIQVIFDNGSDVANSGAMAFSDISGDVVCFAGGTLIETESGPLPVEDLRVGQMIATVDRGLQPIRWIGKRNLNAEDFAKFPHIRPIRIRAGALGDGVPLRDLVVSPQHRILIRSEVALRMFDSDEVLVAAKQLLDHPGVELAHDVSSVTYVYFMLDNHEVVNAEGALAETLYTGPEAMKALSPAAKREIELVFGELPYLERPFARPVPKGSKARKLVARHVKNQKHLFASF